MTGNHLLRWPPFFSLILSKIHITRDFGTILYADFRYVAQRNFGQLFLILVRHANTRTKDHLCKFQDIWLSSKSWILDIKFVISTKKCRFWFTILLLNVCQVFINLQDHLHFSLHFVFSFMGQLFMDDPVTLYSI